MAQNGVHLQNESEAISTELVPEQQDKEHKEQQPPTPSIIDLLMTQAGTGLAKDAIEALKQYSSAQSRERRTNTYVLAGVIAIAVACTTALTYLGKFDAASLGTLVGTLVGYLVGRKTNSD